MGDDQQLRVTSAAISSGDAEAQHEMEQPRSLNAAGIEEEIAGEEAQDLDQADMFTGGTDSEILQDEEEVAAIHSATTEGRRKTREEERTSCESSPQSCMCRRALVQGRQECAQIFKHERAPITRPCSRHSFPLTLHAPTVQRCPRQRRAHSLKAIVLEAAAPAHVSDFFVVRAQLQHT